MRIQALRCIADCALFDLQEQGQIPEVFDEIDVLEKLATLWEAVNILKSNEESIAVRIVKQDVLLKKVPGDMMEKLRKSRIMT
jgi:hypothetical protein